MATLPNGGKLSLDYKAIGVIMRSPGMRDAVEQAAQGVVASYSGSAESIEVRTYVTDRAVAAIVVSGPGVYNDELVNGSLIAAARASGLEARG